MHAFELAVHLHSRPFLRLYSRLNWCPLRTCIRARFAPELAPAPCTHSCPLSACIRARSALVIAPAFTPAPRLHLHLLPARTPLCSHFDFRTSIPALPSHFERPIHSGVPYPVICAMRASTPSGSNKISHGSVLSVPCGDLYQSNT